MKRFWFGAGCVVLGTQAAIAQDKDATAIIVTAPGPPGELKRDSEVEAEVIRGEGRPDFLGAMVRSVPGLSLQDAQNNPYQPNLIYRGFTASPLQGQAQGLAVYLDGGRFNQPFGDTVQFDLLPEIAIQSIDLLGPNPVYGLNALGGALIVGTKTGWSAPGGFVSGSVGSFGEAEGLAEYGWSRDNGSLYLARGTVETADGGVSRHHTSQTCSPTQAGMGRWAGCA